MAELHNKTTAELRELLQSGQSAAEKEQKEAGCLTARERMKLLFDEGTFVEIGAYIGRKRTELDSDADDSFEPVITGYGAVNGALVFAFSQDFSRLHGALGEMHAKKIVKIIEMADKASAPLVGVFDSAGAKILEGVDALAGYGSIMGAIAESDSVKIAVVSGICGGASSVVAEMFDIVLAAEKTGKLYVSSSGKSSSGVSADQKLIDLLCAEDADAILKARALLDFFTDTVSAKDDINRTLSLDGILSNEAYDIHDVIDTVLDTNSFTEIGAHYGASMVTGFAAINGKAVAVVANNPAVKGGLICPCAVEKATKLLRVASLAELPVLTLVDTDGVADMAHAEEKGFARLLAKLASAYSYLTNAAVTVTLGKSYGTAYTVMGSKALTNGVALALDRARISAMSPERAVAFLDEVDDESRHGEIAAEWAVKYASPLQAAKSGHIDDIVSESELRQRIGAALEMLI